MQQIQIEILMNGQTVGWLTHDAKFHQFSFQYDSTWLERADRFPLSPQLPLEPTPEISKELHSAAVRQFFENLLPEGQALDDAAIAHQISKANLMGMLMAISKETSGALSVGRYQQEHNLRELTGDEISQRIRARPHQSFAVWDGKVRLSIAGFQDKIAALLLDGEWYLPEGQKYASTHILKPEPVSEVMRGMTSNEFFCMRLAERIRLPVAPVALMHVPEPVLVVTRFDRQMTSDGVDRLHYIDGCQALGLPTGFKMERPYGSGKDVAQIRTGASYKALFELLEKHTSAPAKQRLDLLRWAIYHVLIGNTDAHAKNISFRSSSAGLSMAPAYDLVSGASFMNEDLDKSYAMAIGDAFTSEELSPYEWANFANECGLQFNLVSRILNDEAQKILSVIDEVKREVIDEEADVQHIERVEATIKTECQRHLLMANEIKKISKDMF